MDLHELEMETLFAEVFNLVKLTHWQTEKTIQKMTILRMQDLEHREWNSHCLRPVGEEICDPGPGGRGDLKMVHTYDFAL